ncbi:hypothetical protein CF336_g4649 [Tilletia laevis]|uniref:Uncharacterized protein n=1 Tax=Tilletia caries TaxID=13290 RepID=A0A8T8TFG1_9BASI|nr:hypothetical protein CF336_g4649 [Tilletia laevis]KAE8259697.1 hypothetical protein A4X03_0g4024 [Tilletia caries]
MSGYGTPEASRPTRKRSSTPETPASAVRLDPEASANSKASKGRASSTSDEVSSEEEVPAVATADRAGSKAKSSPASVVTFPTRAAYASATTVPFRRWNGEDPQNPSRM